ncbi:MAG: BON domain-containing protein [Vicinamibacteria bacterium]|nr:BON domain-containing protein [Vicinamibacteria bacterium]
MIRKLFKLIVFFGVLGGGLYAWYLYRGGIGGLAGVQQQVADTKITGSVKTAFALNRRLKVEAISVATEDGVVTLRGEISSEELKARALSIAQAVPDVRLVVDHLRVVAGIAPRTDASLRTMGESLDDHALEMEARLALSLDRVLKERGLQVGVYRRVVTLKGEVKTAAERERALAIVQDIAGVLSVSDQLGVREAARTRAQLVERAFAENAHIAPYRLRVREQADRLVLAGRVQTGAERDLAAMLAREAAGGVIANEIELVAPRAEKRQPR